MSYNRNSVFGNLLNEAENTFQVADEYRTNPLSHVPGGRSVKVKYRDGSSRVYDKIKNVEAYTRNLFSRRGEEIAEVIPM